MFSRFSVHSPSQHAPAPATSSASHQLAAAPSSANPSTPSPLHQQARLSTASASTSSTPSSPKVRPGQTQACEECRRRKSKCDQQKPVCGRCRATGKADRCVYVAQRPRIVPSQRAINELAGSLQQARSILDKLFPADALAQAYPAHDSPTSSAAATAFAGPHDEEQKPSIAALEDRQSLTFLDSLTSDQLRDLIPRLTNAASHDGRPLAAFRKAPALPSEHNEALAALRYHDDGGEFDEDSLDHETDDINALNLSTNKATSYVGSSSVSTALRVIAALCPRIVQQDRLRADSNRSAASSRSLEKDLTSLVGIQVPSQKEQAFINAYFENIHPVVPMLNEARFRHDYSTGLRNNSSWLGLLNMVLCMGSIAAQTSHDMEHLIYYQRARQCLTFDSFGSGRIETVQALAIMGGWYLHYSNQPNMAMTITGTAIRMAYALGLHCLAPPDADREHKHADPDYEMKVKTWWCVICLDVWGSTTTGRPSMPDYFGPAVSTPSPAYQPIAYAPKDWNASLSSKELSQLEMTQLTAELKFVEISARIQDRLAIAPSLSHTEMEALDSALELAFVQMPPILRAPNPCPAFLETPRAILKWRYQNSRYLLRRPVLLAAAVERRNQLSEFDRRSIAMCRDIARETIGDISKEWKANHFSGWHAAWNLFQATFVPLVSLFSSRDSSETDEWRRQVECACDLYLHLDQWSRAAPKTRQVLKDLLDSSRAMSSSSPSDDNSSFMVDNWERFNSQHSWAENLLGNMDSPRPLDSPHLRPS